MKTILKSACIIAAFIMTNAMSAQPNTKLRPDKTVFLYQKAAVELSDPVQGKTKEALGLEIAEDNGYNDGEEISETGGIRKISENARFDLYFPKKPNGTMLIVCPGGGYGNVSSYNEGVYVAEWMKERGYTVAIAKYRLPNGHWEVPLTDIHNIFRYCRAHAAEWNVDKIGVMGFSAGGHLAASATTLYTDKETRPDFSVLIYPVIAIDKTPSHKGTRLNLIGNEEKWASTEGKTAEEWISDQKLHEELVKKYTLSNDITPDTPPVFLAHCTDDKTVPVINSIIFYNGLVNNGVEAEMHIFPKGGHGWGFSSERYVEKDKIGYARDEFETLLARWLSER